MENLNAASALFYSATYVFNVATQQIENLKLYTLKEFNQAKKDFKVLQKQFPGQYSFTSVGNPFTSVEDAKIRIEQDTINYLATCTK